MQINIGHLDANGVYNNQFTTFAVAGSVRAMVRLVNDVHVAALDRLLAGDYRVTA